MSLKMRLINTTGRLSLKIKGEATNHMPERSPSLNERKKVSAAVVGNFAAGLNNCNHQPCCIKHSSEDNKNSLVTYNRYLQM